MILFSCKDYGSNPVSPDGGDSDDAGDNSSYVSLDIQGIFSLNCVQCHSSFESYNQVISSGLVVPGDAASSELYNRITLPQNDPESMPRNLPSLSNENIELIETWINEGALP